MVTTSERTITPILEQKLLQGRLRLWYSFDNYSSSLHLWLLWLLWLLWVGRSGAYISGQRFRTLGKNPSYTLGALHEIRRRAIVSDGIVRILKGPWPKYLWAGAQSWAVMPTCLSRYSERKVCSLKASKHQSVKEHIPALQHSSSAKRNDVGINQSALTPRVIHERTST